MTATQSVNESMDLTAIASENVVTAVARSVTLSDADVGKPESHEKDHLMKQLIPYSFKTSHSHRPSDQTDSNRRTYYERVPKISRDNASRGRWLGRRWKLLANLYREVQVCAWRPATAPTVLSSATQRTAQYWEAGHPILHVTVPKRSGAARRRPYQGFKRPSRISHLVPGESSD